MREPPFDALTENGALGNPQTDGKKIYWSGGPSITLEEILEMLISCGRETSADKTKR